MSALRALMGLIDAKAAPSAAVVSKKAKWDKLKPFLDKQLLPFAHNLDVTAEHINKLEKMQPALIEQLTARVAKDPHATGVVPTVDAPRDPALCAYTTEGSLAHKMMQKVKLLERREKGTFYDGLKWKSTPEDAKAQFEAATRADLEIQKMWEEAKGGSKLDIDAALKEALAKADKEGKFAQSTELPFKEVLMTRMTL